MAAERERERVCEIERERERNDEEDLQTESRVPAVATRITSTILQPRMRITSRDADCV